MDNDSELYRVTLEKNLVKHTARHLEYDRAFARYIIVGSATTIALILNAVLRYNVNFQDYPILRFVIILLTLSLLISGVCIKLNSYLARSYAVRFGNRVGVITGVHPLSNEKLGSTKSLKMIYDVVPIDPDGQLETKRRIIDLLQIISGFIFAFCISTALYLVLWKM